jgi:hypothetical protein
MAVDTVTTIVSLGGLAAGMVGTYVTVRSYYDKRQSEDRQRQREELERLQAARQKELDEYATGKQKAYAAERDFGHLMRQYETLTTNIKVLSDYQSGEIKGLEADLKEIKAMLNLLLIHMGQTDTSVLRHLKRESEG